MEQTNPKSPTGSLEDGTAKWPNRGVGAGEISLMNLESFFGEHVADVEIESDCVEPTKVIRQSDGQHCGKT